MWSFVSVHPSLYVYRARAQNSYFELLGGVKSEWKNLKFIA